MHTDDITIAADEISPGTVEVVPFLERELVARGIHLNPVALARRDKCDRERHRDSARWGGGTTRADVATNAG